MKPTLNSINKIICELSQRDYRARISRLTEGQKKKLKYGLKTLSDFGGYTLSGETIFFINLKNDYISGNISEEEIKAECLRFKLREI